MTEWVKEFSAEIMVCDAEGIILEMNNEAEQLFSNEGGRGLLGSNVLDCHPEPSRKKLAGMLDNQTANAYFNTEAGEKRFFFQAPWKRDGQYTGFVEISFSVPDEIQHFLRG